MKHTIACLAIGLLPLCVMAQHTGIGTTTPHPSAVLDITGTNGLLIPRMTTPVRNAIVSPAKGLLVFDSTLGTMVFYNGTAWTEMVHTGNNLWLKSGSNMYANSVNVGIGTLNPGFGLHVVNSNSQEGGWMQGIMVENLNEGNDAGEAAISFRNKSFSAGKQWSVGINQTSSPLAFNFGSTFSGGNTRMVIDTLGRVGMGTGTPETSAQLHLNSTARGLIMPRMSSEQRLAIQDPALGLFVYDTDKRSLYMYDGGDWVTFAPQAPGFVPVTLRTVDTIPQDFLDIGNEVAVSGEFAVTRSTKYTINGFTNAGCVFVYKKNEGNWDYVQQLLPDVPKANILYGSALALSGNILVVGSAYWDTHLVNKGKVWYYEWDGAAFQFLDSLVISPGTAEDNFGFSLALRGNMLVVGAPQENTNGADAGGIYVYTFNEGTKRFGSRVRLSAPNAKAGDKLGYAVDIDGAYVAAGAPFHPFGAGVNKGIVHVWTGSGVSWGYQDSCTFASASTNYERLGLFLSLSGINLVCGANYKLSASYNPGSAIWFKRSGSQWSNTQEIRSDDTDNSSTVPQVITRNNWLLIGNSAEDNIPGPTGNVWVYALENNEWVRKRRIYNYSVNEANQRWCDSMAFDGTTIVIGSYTYKERLGAIYFTTVTE
jgi:FG-GAP repeat